MDLRRWKNYKQCIPVCRLVKQKRTGVLLPFMQAGKKKKALLILEIKGRKGHNAGKSLILFLVVLPALFVPWASQWPPRLSQVLHKFLEMTNSRAEFSPFPSRCLEFSLLICLWVFHYLVRKLLNRWALYFGLIKLNSNGL